MTARTHWKKIVGLLALWLVSAGCQTAAQTQTGYYCPNCKEYHSTAAHPVDQSIPMTAPASEIAPGPVRSISQAPQLLPAPAPEISAASEREADAIQIQWTSGSR